MAKDEQTNPVEEIMKDMEETAAAADEVRKAEDAADDAMHHVEEELTELQSTIAELKDKHIRLLAEFDNYKKRTMRERLDLLESAGKDILLTLLPVLDDFDRAHMASETGPEQERFSEGVTLVYNRLYSVLQAKGLKAIDSNGQPFDPEWHEAITEIPAPTPDMKGKVIDTIQKGYTLGDKIIRHAKVVVGN